MDRRLFLRFPALAAVATMLGGAGVAVEDRIKRGFKVGAGRDRWEDELHIMGGSFRRMVSAKDTDGDLCIYHTTRQEKGGPALHLHFNQDEWFCPIDGEFIMQVGDDRFELKGGDSVFAPRGVPHAFAKVSEGEAHMLVLFQPAGTMEEFFAEVGSFGPDIPKDQETLWKDLWAAHGMQLVGPPLQF